MIKTRHALIRPALVMTVAALTLAACGGGGDDADEATTTVAPTTTAAPTTSAKPRRRRFLVDVDVEHEHDDHGPGDHPSALDRRTGRQRGRHHPRVRRMVVKIDNVERPTEPHRPRRRRHRVRGDRRRQRHALRGGVPQPERRPDRADPFRPHAGHRPVRFVQLTAVRLERRQRWRHQDDRRVDADQHGPEPRPGLLPRTGRRHRTTCTTAPTRSGCRPRRSIRARRLSSSRTSVPTRPSSATPTAGVTLSVGEHEGRLDVEPGDRQVRPSA